MIDGNVLDSFFVALGFKVDKKGIENFQTSFEQLRETALHLAEALSLPALGLFVERVAKSLGDMQHFAEVNHLSTAELQAFNAIARENHIDVDAMDHGIAELNKRLGQAQLGTGRLLPILKKLGIGLKDTHGHAKDLNQILGDVADKMKKLTPSENLGLGQRLGLDPGMISLLQEGSENWRKVFGEAQKNVAFTQEDLDLAEKTDKLFVKARHDLDVMFDLIALKIMPAVGRLLERFVAWYKAASADKNSLLNRSLDLMARFADIAADEFGRVLDAVSKFASFVSTYVLPDWITEQLPKLAYLIIPALIAGFVMLGAYAVGQLAIAGRAVIAFCAAGIEWFTAFSIAELVALWPIEAIIIAVTALGIAAYEIYAHWNGIIQWFGHALNWIFDRVGKVTAAIGGLLRGSTTGPFVSEHTARVLHESEAARGQTATWAQPRWGSQSFSKSHTVVQHITGTTIQVVSPDPEKAGEKVKEALREDTHRRLMRNSQGFVF